MITVRCPQAAGGGGSKTQNGRFLSKIALHLKKVCYKVFCVNTVSDKVVRHSLAYLRAKMVPRDVPYNTGNFGGNGPTPLKTLISDPINIRS